MSMLKVNKNIKSFSPKSARGKIYVIEEVTVIQYHYYEPYHKYMTKSQLPTCEFSIESG